MTARSKPVRGKPHNPFPLNPEGEVSPLTPEEDQELRQRALREGVSYAQFLERARRYWRLTRRRTGARYARGLDSNPEDFA
jgi:hypothetical protein